MVSKGNTYRYGISSHGSQNLTVPGDNANSSWLLVTPTDIHGLIGHGKVDNLILDLNGAEWDIFPALLDSSLLAEAVQHLDLRIR
ncbi:unnamed protein product [Gongylonema pulchrum]|uniref:Methyltransf_21 domain-containing protein n=1 Tax=Gongylonema pulchrum TaxID=637853 RepID=A0A183DFX0_9BILA|nr:unnamed protein product [Gongylonema pulchrum]